MKALRTSLLGLLAVPALFASSPVSAGGGTRQFEVYDFDAFDKGETEGAAIESMGKVTVGYLPIRSDVAGTTAFTCLAEKSSVLVGTADKAALLRVFPAKKLVRPRKAERKAKKKGADDEAPTKARDLKVETVAELDGVVVSALASLPGGDTLAAVVPGGKIYRVDKRGKVSTFAELAVDQIWALQVHDGRVLAATGPKGELWSLSLEGKKPKVVLDTDQKDLLSLAVVGKDVVVGTSPGAQLFQVTDDLEGVLLHDFNGEEVRALAVTKTGLMAAVNDFSDRKLTSLDALTKTLNRTSLTGQPPTGALSSEKTPSADAAIYRVDLGPKLDLARASEAPWEKWLEREKQYFTSLLALPDNQTVLASSSAGGKVYRVRGPRDTSTVADLEERQATGLCVLPKGQVFATTAHGAAVYQLQAASASSARYRTEVFDAIHPAAYGAIVLKGSGELRVRVRGGPTDEPDKRWSDWKKVTLGQSADGLRGSLSDLPHRRHLQVEVALASPGSELRGLEVFYAPENLAPLLEKIEIDHPSFETDDDKEPGSDVTIKWKADARDDDDLVYDVRIRPEGSTDKEWIKLNPDGEPVSKKELKLDLTTVPDGIYEVEVRASDAPSNGTARARTDELTSAPFVVDRQRPIVNDVRVLGTKITARAQDSGGYIHDVGFSIDGGKFRAASPADGLFDSPDEALAIELPDDLSPGKHRIVIRARDSFGNIGTAAVVVEK